MMTAGDAIALFLSVVLMGDGCNLDKHYEPSHHQTFTSRCAQPEYKQDDPLSFVNMTASPLKHPDVSSILGINTHNVFSADALDAALMMGLSWIRADLFWSASEKSPGIYNFSDWDYNFLHNLKARGLKAIAVLGYGNHLYTGHDDTAPTSPTQFRAYANFAEAAAAHFAANAISYELYNEPNGDKSWSTSISPQAFAQLINEAADAIHKKNPSAIVIAGGLQFDLEYPNAPVNYMKSVLQAGGARRIDAVAWHGYQFGDDPETIVGRYQQWNKLLRDFFPYAAPQTFQTEAGYRLDDLGGSYATQTSKIVRMILSQWAVGFRIIILYSWDSLDGYSIRGTPTVTAIRYLTSVSKGRELVAYAMPAADASAWYGLRLEGAEDTIGIIWLRQGERTILLPLKTRATDVYGNTLEIPRLGDQLSLTLNASNGPIYLKFAKNCAEISQW